MILILCASILWLAAMLWMIATAFALRDGIQPWEDGK